MPRHCRNICLTLLFTLLLSARADSWPMFRGGPALKGVASGTLPAKLQLIWKFKTAGPVKSSPAIENGKVFVGSNDGQVYALNLATGVKVWESKTGGPVESSPLALEGKVFVGSSDGSLYALDAKTGTVIWKYATEDKILGAPNWTRFPATSKKRETVKTVKDPSGTGNTQLKLGVNETAPSGGIVTAILI